MKIEKPCFWRFKGELPWRYGWPTKAALNGTHTGLIHTAIKSGGCPDGIVVSEQDVDVRQSIYEK
jgi:hypothetical protein